LPKRIQNGNHLPMNFLRAHPEGVCLALKVQPRAPKNGFGPALGGELKIKIASPPVKGAANDTLIGFLAETFDCRASALQIMRGQMSRHKLVLLRGVTLEQARQRLAPWLNASRGS